MKSKPFNLAKLSKALKVATEADKLACLWKHRLKHGQLVTHGSGKDATKKLVPVDVGYVFEQLNKFDGDMRDALILALKNRGWTGIRASYHQQFKEANSHAA